MSRIGRMPIEVPPQVSVHIKDGEIAVKGPKGELKRRLNPEMTVTLDSGKLSVSRPSDAKAASLWLKISHQVANANTQRRCNPPAPAFYRVSVRFP